MEVDSNDAVPLYANPPADQDANSRGNIPGLSIGRLSAERKPPAGNQPLTILEISWKAKSDTGNSSF